MKNNFLTLIAINFVFLSFQSIASPLFKVVAKMETKKKVEQVDSDSKMRPRECLFDLAYGYKDLPQAKDAGLKILDVLPSFLNVDLYGYTYSEFDELISPQIEKSHKKIIMGCYYKPKNEYFAVKLYVYFSEDGYSKFKKICCMVSKT